MVTCRRSLLSLAGAAICSTWSPYSIFHGALGCAIQQPAAIDSGMGGDDRSRTFKSGDPTMALWTPY